ncbi:hypothetical protein Purlil1_7059 [Purpureocillium lilacinum]|uniref:Uncharacterized protein n=1 Tax=Purpureocillium lilacinum TaxID=33203 RepID=A0ABR0BXV8_PURLI|nr:hypothetical protein Purlil1_7059 [Purpureocillium lilacinum]
MQKLLARVVIRNSQRPGQPRAFPRSYYAPVTTSSYMATSVELPHIKRLSRGDYEVITGGQKGRPPEECSQAIGPPDAWLSSVSQSAQLDGVKQNMDEAVACALWGRGQAPEPPQPNPERAGS